MKGSKVVNKYKVSKVGYIFNNPSYAGFTLKKGKGDSAYHVNVRKFLIPNEWTIGTTTYGTISELNDTPIESMLYSKDEEVRSLGVTLAREHFKKLGYKI